MEIKGKTILITGGSAGIGLEAARQFLSQGAKVIICGRDQNRLDNAKKIIPQVTAISCDVADSKDLERLLQEVITLGGIDILYNNAGVGTQPLNLGIANRQHYDDATYEININYLAVIKLTNLFMDMLKNRKEAAIINTTSVLSILPAVLAPTYSATKAALSFYTRSLRIHLEVLNSNVHVFELLPPLVETEMTAGINKPKISTSELVSALLKGIKNDTYTIRVGNTKLLYMVNRFFPKRAFSILNDKKSYSILK